ncbi:Gfo/Idh/MocA family protein [Evansella sp. AB-rgal1]|uniref:Gfo/Idh/MocA family protein n=1 Tax=Evansella sp. AB-rgal1 TaxID=3242696 RepID=UPI00359ED3C9
MQKIRWGIIGCGDVTEKKSGPGFQKADSSELVAVMRRNAQLAEDYARRHNVLKWYSDGEALVADPDVDAVYVATPPSSHMEYALLAAKYKKPVYVEKPMALNFEQCLKMIRACEIAQTPLFVAYYRRALPRFVKIKQLLDIGAIGEPRFVSSTQYQPPIRTSGGEIPWRVDPNISGGGLFHDLGSHTLDILDFLLGPIKEAKGFASNQSNCYNAEDTISASYVFESGIHGVGIWNFSSYKNEDINEIVGSKGKLIFSTFGHEPIKLVTDTGVQEWVFPTPEHIQQPLIETMVRDLLENNGACPSTGKSAARTNWVMDQIVG